MADKRITTDDELNKNLKAVQDLLKQSIAIQLYLGGATQDEIARNLRIAKGTVNAMVKGIKKDTSPRAKKEGSKQKSKQIEQPRDGEVTDQVVTDSEA